MASIPTQEEILAATRKSQEAMIAAIKNWLETVRTATPKLTSVYAPLTDKLPKLPSVSLPFADKLPTPEEAVDNAYHMAEQLLASQRKFTEELLKAMTPLIPGRGERPAKGNGSSEPKVPGHRVWPGSGRRQRAQARVAGSEPKPVAVSEPKPPWPRASPKHGNHRRRRAQERPSVPPPRARPLAGHRGDHGLRGQEHGATEPRDHDRPRPARPKRAKTAPKSTPNSEGPASEAPKGPDAS